MNNNWIKSIRPATQKELIPLFDAEAKRSGFVKGAKYNSFQTTIPREKTIATIRDGKPVYNEDFDYFGYADEAGWIYLKGTWATLVQEPELNEAQDKAKEPNYHQQFEDCKYALRNIKKLLEEAEKRVGDFNAQ